MSKQENPIWPNQEVPRGERFMRHPLFGSNRFLFGPKRNLVWSNQRVPHGERFTWHPLIAQIGDLDPLIGCNVTFCTAFGFSSLHAHIFVTSNGSEMPKLIYLQEVPLYILLYHETQFCFLIELELCFFFFCVGP